MSTSVVSQMNLFDFTQELPVCGEVFMNGDKMMHVRGIYKGWSTDYLIYTDNKPSKTPQWMRGIPVDEFLEKLKNGEIIRA